MKITLLSDEAIRLRPNSGPLQIEAVVGDQNYSPFHMLASGLAYCTFSVLHSWAEQARLQTDDLTIDVHWSFADRPTRVATYDMHFSWPSLPAKRLTAAIRAADLCSVHATFQHPPTITIEGTLAPPSPEEPLPESGGAAAPIADTSAAT